MNVAFVKQRDDLGDALERLLDNSEPRLRRAFLNAVQRMRDRATLEELAALIAVGRIDEAVELVVGLEEMGPLADEVQDAYIAAGRATAGWAGRAVALTIRFDFTNPRAQQYLQDQGLRLVQQFTARQREATQSAILDGIRRGLNPQDQARAFRDVLGLTERQVQAINNFRELLETGNRDVLNRALRDRRFDRTVARAFDRGEPLTEGQINTMVDRYRERYLRYRSETIARTEALQAVSGGSDEMFQQAFDNGTLDPNDLEQVWRTAADERVRGSHSTMNGQVRAPGEPFLTGNGNDIRYPGDLDAPASERVNCRCVRTVRFRSDDDT